MRGGQTSPRAGTLADDLRRSTEDFESGTATEQAVYAQELERVHDLDKAREVRLLNVSEGLPPVLWFVLVNLGIDTILFTYSVGTKARWLHVLAVAALTGASPSYSSRYSYWIALLAGIFGWGQTRSSWCWTRSKEKTPNNQLAESGIGTDHPPLQEG